jgi:hypothetical protein
MLKHKEKKKQQQNKNNNSSTHKGKETKPPPKTSLGGTGSLPQRQGEENPRSNGKTMEGQKAS